MNVHIITANYTDPRDAGDIASLLDMYASDPMGGGRSLPESVRERVVSELAKIPHAFTVLCRADGYAIGLVNCFEGFSTFQCKPLVNIHDIVVHPDFRGQGLCQKMMARVEEIARDKGCCKLTLEVLEGNFVAQASYKKFGFAGYELDPSVGKALFWEKGL